MNEQTIFIEALQREDVDRAEFLDLQCCGDSTLRERIENLLDLHQRSDEFLDSPAVKVESSKEDLSETDRIGRQIGPYKLLEVIGEGGMGTVYMAEQTEPVHRRVALKLIKTGMDTKQVVARFEAERQALAVMDHPNIAKVLDAGATESGRPYFVMELVKGKPITQFCEEQQLDTRSRLELFQQVCLGVQHAHQKGIIHRDIKPANVLVAMYDDRPVPKVIDFGVAKATAEKLTEKTMFTRFGQIVGTLAYMSPEQAQFNQVDIDTRSDIYSLGAVLYELLTGEPPFEREKIKNQALDETLRMIREDEPTKPSTRISESAIDHLLQKESRRNSSTRRLGLALRNELDWIVMKTLEKDRTRRYETANDFVADIKHYLKGEAVEAHPPSRSYRLKKFCRKYKGPVLAASLVGAALLFGIIGTAIGLMRAETQRQIAEKRAVELKAVSDFQAAILSQFDPHITGKRLTDGVKKQLEASLTRSGMSESARVEKIEEFAKMWRYINTTDTARELIDQAILEPAVAAIDKQFANQPLIDARLREVLAGLYSNLGLWDAALPLQKQVLETYRHELGEEHRDTLNSVDGVAWALYMKFELKDAERYMREAVIKKRRSLKEDDPDTLFSINRLGRLLGEVGELAEAEDCLREALVKRRQILGNEDPATSDSRLQLADVLWMRGSLLEADTYMREALENLQRELGDDNLRTIAAIGKLAALQFELGNLSEAETFAFKALEISRRIRGNDHLYTLRMIGNVGGILHAQGKLSEAESYYREALDGFRKQGEDGPDTLQAMLNLGAMLNEQEKIIDAEPYLREAADKLRLARGLEHRTTLAAISNLGGLLLKQGKEVEAARLLNEIKEPASHTFIGDRAWRYGDVLVNLGKAQTGLNKFAAAEANLLEAQGLIAKPRGAPHKTKIESVEAIVALYEAWEEKRPDHGYLDKANDWKIKLDALSQSPSDVDVEKEDGD